MNNDLYDAVVRNCQICDYPFASNYTDNQYICNDCKCWLNSLKSDYKNLIELYKTNNK